MTLSREFLGRLLFALLTLLILSDAVLFFARYQVRRKMLVQDPRIFVAPRSVDLLIQAPRGFNQEGAAFHLNSQHSAGLIIRYASRTCHWCQQDQPYWNALAQEALKRHFDILIVTPNAGAEYPPSAVQPPNTKQLTFVDLRWLASVRLRGTPTTLISDHNHKLTWGHEGALTSEDVKLATAAMSDATS